MEQELDLYDIWQTVAKRWKIIITIPLVIMMVTGLVTLIFITPQYRAEAKLIVVKHQDPITAPEITLSRMLVKTYAEIATSRMVLHDVAQDLDLPYGFETLKGKVSVTPARDTEVIYVQATDPSPIVARNIANQVTSVFMERVVEIMQVDNVSVIDTAVIPSSPFSPRPLLNLAVALVIGLMAGVGLAFLLEYLDNSIKTPEEVQKYLDLPVLGVIPYFEER